MVHSRDKKSDEKAEKKIGQIDQTKISEKKVGIQIDWTKKLEQKIEKKKIGPKNGTFK